MKKIISLIAAIGLTTSMYANDNTGCGLGSLVIKDQSTVMLQVLAATTNGTSGSQTFGITSGTSNCNKPSNFVANDKLNQFEHLINQAYKFVGTLRERRITLISSAVTGKIDVRNWQHPNEAKTGLSS